MKMFLGQDVSFCRPAQQGTAATIPAMLNPQQTVGNEADAEAASLPTVCQCRHLTGYTS